MSGDELRIARRSIPDGRLQRAERSRTAIVKALHDLIGEGSLVPTAQDVATRAGVGMRTVFRHFSAMDDLFAELDQLLRAEIQPLLNSQAPTGPLPTRILQLAERRAALYERVGPYLRATRLHHWRSDFLEQQLKATVRDLRHELRQWVPELKGRPNVLETLDLLLAFETWDRLRTEQRLGVARALNTLEPLLVQAASELKRKP
ncbi:MAG: AcrR family transcriptional regulator [Hyphomicrobiaceae bacterium]|jgi:AcrR family transcriptional regulator